jgi:serine/threonine protein kinase
MSKTARIFATELPDSIRLFGRLYPIIGSIAVRRKTYLLLDRLSSAYRERYLGFDRQGHVNGRPVVILHLPRSVAGSQHLDVLADIANRHDSLPTILDYEVRRNRTTVVLSWVHGISLASFMNDANEGRRRFIGPTVAFHRVRALAHALVNRHGKRHIVHGDIKPQNLIVTAHPGRFVPIDFGSAWHMNRTVSRDEGDGITSAYAAPELQCGQRYADFRCDLFSLSVVLYELLTRKLPYDGLGGKAGRPEFDSAMASNLVSPSALSPSRADLPKFVWKSLDRVVTRGLKLDPDDRHPTPQAWLDELDAVNLDIQRPLTLSPLLDRLTRAVTWVVNHLQMHSDK